MTHIIGIDPGLEGGIVVMDGESRIVTTARMPTTPGKRKSLNFFEIRALFERVPDSGLVGVELISPQGNANGKVGTITAAKGVGIILGICLAMAYRDGMPVTTRISRAMRPDVIGLCLDHSARKLMQEALMMRAVRGGNPEISGCGRDFGTFRG